MTNEEKINEIFTELSDLMGVEIQFKMDEEDQGRMIPAYNIDAVISKMLALFVFSGLNVSSSFAPPYNRVHADIEWWKNKFSEAQEVKSEEAPAPPASE